MRAAAAAVLLAASAMGQVQHGGAPRGLESGRPLRMDLSSVKVPDTARLLREDNVSRREKPERIADLIDVSTSLADWTREAVEGGSLHRVLLSSPGAFALGLNFARYQMPEGAQMFVYSANGATVRGSFTHENVKSYGGFSVLPVKGSEAVVEVFVPAGAKAEVAVESVAHHYKNTWFAPQEARAKGLEGCYGCSGRCNVNAACSEGNGWEEQSAGVAAILSSSGSALCSGSMINNVNEDGKQYFLSANHCGCSSARNWIMVFNYQTSGCQNSGSEPSDSQSVQGSVVRGSSGLEDYCLIEIEETIPDSYGAVLNGFDARDADEFDRPFSISHPSGDVKKIGGFGGIATPSGYFGSGKSHWYIAEWDFGVTEGGSSGSPIFDSNKRIRGQLHGGQASCSYLYVDYYGRISESWSASSALKTWLDPDNSGERVVDAVPLAQLRAKRSAAKKVVTTATLETAPGIVRDEKGRIDIASVAALVTNSSYVPPLGVVGGTEVRSAADYPWMAGWIQSGRQRCGSALISDKWVLSAAHCYGNVVPQTSLGSLRAPSGAEVVNGRRAIRHPSYNAFSLDYDVMLIELDAAVSFSNSIKPVRLATPNDGDFAGDMSTVTGWGATRSGGSGSSTLREVTYPVITNSYCSSMYSGITSRMLCSYQEGGGLDACQGDSGGPLVVEKNGEFIHVGVVSWGQGCAGNRAPGVYARTSFFHDWICTNCGCC